MNEEKQRGASYVLLAMQATNTNFSMFQWQNFTCPHRGCRLLWWAYLLVCLSVQ